MPLSPLPLLLCSVGAYVLIKIRCFYILHPCRSLRAAFGALKRRENLAAFTLALAGTLGVGNVLGVAVGIMVGGAGSLFWIFISAIPASALKYAEVLIASDRGGMLAAIRRSFRSLGGLASGIYAAACMLLSFVMGAALQSRSVADVAESAIGLDGNIATVILTAFVLISILGVGGKMGKITIFVIPLTTIIYIILAISTIIAHFERLPQVLSEIINGAFSPEACGGGLLAHLSSRAMREGFSRGMLSNEAGAGTSSLAHYSGGELEAGVRAMHGVLEVVFDTSVLCTLSGLAILSAVPDPAACGGGMELVVSAISGTLGGWSAVAVMLSVFAFAYSTVICWYYYGGLGAEHPRRRGGGPLYSLLFLCFVLLGGVISEGALVLCSDVLLLVLTLLVLPTVIKNSDRIALLSESCGLLGSLSAARGGSEESDP